MKHSIQRRRQHWIRQAGRKLAYALVAVHASTAVAHAGVTPSEPVPDGAGGAMFLGGHHDGTALYRTDGTSAGTRVLRTFCSRPTCLRPMQLAEVGGLPLLVATAGDIDRSYRIGASGKLEPAHNAQRARVEVPAIQVVDHQLFTIERDGAQGFMVTRYDGRLSLVRQTAGLPTQPSVLGARDDGLTFLSAPGVTGGRDLIAVDAAGQRTTVAQLATSIVDPPVLEDGLLWFSGFDAAHGSEPWVSDGTAAGTRMLADLVPGAASPYVFGAGPVRGRTWYVTDVDPATNTGRFHRLSMSGSSTDVTLLQTAEYSAYPSQVIGLAGGALVVTTTSSRWYPSGEPSGANVPMGAPGYVRYPVARHNDAAAYYVDEMTTPSLWRTDGTGSGTVRVTNIPPGPSFRANGEAAVTWIAKVGAYTYFDATAQGENARQLWRTDGTAEGTVLVTRPGQFTPAPPSIATLNATARGAGSRVRVRVSGTIEFPSATYRPDRQCATGSLRITFGAGVRRERFERVPFRWTGSACAYRLTARLRERDGNRPIRVNAFIAASVGGHSERTVAVEKPTM
jgi:ELWxxDGT repeat protein